MRANDQLPTGPVPALKTGPGVADTAGTLLAASRLPRDRWEPASPHRRPERVVTMDETGPNAMSSCTDAGGGRRGAVRVRREVLR